MDWPTWEWLMDTEEWPLTAGPEPHQAIKRVLIQAVASLTCQPQFEHLTPWQTYEKIVGWAQQIAAADAVRA
jgi:hypothetical protein